MLKLGLQFGAAMSVTASRPHVGKVTSFFSAKLSTTPGIQETSIMLIPSMLIEVIFNLMILKLKHVSELPGGLIKPRIIRSHFWFLIQ
jgi:hypothetical protein